MQRTFFFILLLGFAFAGANEMTPLFNGKNLDGWVQRGGVAKYEVVDGVIVGTTVPKTPNSFLCTEKDYGDFVLELEFKVDPALNCGVQFRSLSDPEFKDGRVHGYQCEIDPSDRAWTGGIYDESRRGWLYDLSKNRRARYAFKQNEWNHFRIVAIGARIRTYLNGIPAADLIDSMTQKGFIALQVHGIGNREETLQVRYRNINILDLGESKWEPLFNGKDLTGFSSELDQYWSVKDGILHGKCPKSEKRHSILFVDGQEFGDFTARVKYRANSGNSGFYFRTEKVDSAVSVHGFQAEIDSEGRDESGIYETGGRAWVAKPDPKLIEKNRKTDDWNTLDVNAYGDRVTTNLNGHRMVELANDPGRKKGFMGVQLHGNQDMDVEFAAIKILTSENKIEDHTPGWPTAKSTGKTSAPLIKEGAEWKQLGSGYKFTEGPALGPDGRIYFNDIPNEKTHVFDPKTGNIEVFRENTGRANGLYFTGPGAMLACEGGNRQITRIDIKSGEATVIADAFEGKKLNSPNDLVLDGIGGIYFTDPRYGKRDDMELEVEAVYYRDRRGKITRVAGGLTKPNGIILSPDESILYIADPGAETIFAYDVKAPGQISGKRKFAAVGSDGMTVDTEGNIYVTWKGEVIAFSPEGKEVLRSAPPEAPANVLLVGKTLYATARTGFYAIEIQASGLDGE